MEYREKIRNLRENKGMTLEDLAEKLNVSKQMVCQIERGTKILTVPMAFAIARVFGVSISEIISD